MLRRLLTLLAVFAGFVSLVEPVQAARMDTGVEAAAQTERVSACTEAMLVATQQARRVDATPGARAARCATTAMGLVPAVRVKADRARE